MTKAVRFHKTGGPEVLQLDDVQVAAPGQGQVRVRHTAIGVNFIDTYQRSGTIECKIQRIFKKIPVTNGNIIDSFIYL